MRWGSYFTPRDFCTNTAIVYWIAAPATLSLMHTNTTMIWVNPPDIEILYFLTTTEFNVNGNKRICLYTALSFQSKLSQSHFNKSLGLYHTQKLYRDSQEDNANIELERKNLSIRFVCRLWKILINIVKNKNCLNITQKQVNGNSCAKLCLQKACYSHT